MIEVKNIIQTRKLKIGFYKISMLIHSDAINVLVNQPES